MINQFSDACFGTPLASAIFALEGLALDRIKFENVIPALVAAGIADLVCSAWGAPHTQYRIGCREKIIRKIDLLCPANSKPIVAIS